MLMASLFMSLRGKLSGAVADSERSGGGDRLEGFTIILLIKYAVGKLSQ